MFDLDGTLLDSAPDMLAVVNHMRAQHGHAPMPLADLRPVVSKGARAMLAAAFPVLFVGLTQWASPDIRSVVCVVAGVLAVIGAGSNLLAMLVSHMMIGFGVSSSSRDQTVFIWIIPAFQALFGLASIVAGSSDRFAGWLNHCLN